MTKDELVAEMQRIILANRVDPEASHAEVDDLLVQYINDPEVTELFDKMEKWYA